MQMYMQMYMYMHTRMHMLAHAHAQYLLRLDKLGTTALEKSPPSLRVGTHRCAERRQFRQEDDNGATVRVPQVHRLMQSPLEGGVLRLGARRAAVVLEHGGPIL